MTNPIINDTKKSARDLAAQIAKQMAREPLEILKESRNQITGSEFPFGKENNQENQEEQQKKITEQKELQDKMKSQRLIDAYNRELEDIRKQKLFSELQRRISEGEEIPLEEYPGLSLEQKQVLKAQMEAVKTQMLNAKYANDKSFGIPAPSSKPSRRFGAGQKQQAQKEQTRVEKPVPPSG